MIKTWIGLDLQNMFYFVKKQKRRIDFSHLNKEITHGRENSKCYAYLTTSSQTESSYLIENLENKGFKVIHNKLNKDKRHLKQLNKTVSMTLDIVDSVDLYDEFVLLTLDPTVTDLINFLKAQGKKVEVWTFEPFVSDFEGYADKVQTITEEFYLKRNKN